MLRMIKYLTIINLYSWLLAMTSAVIIWYFKGSNKEYVVFYFIVLSFFRFIFPLYKIINIRLLSLIHFENKNFNYRISLIFSQLSNTFTQNIWTTIIAIRLNLEANAVYSLFYKLRDLSLGNLSHSLHRIAIKNLKYFSPLKNKTVLNGFKVIIFGSIIFVVFLWFFKAEILLLFNNSSQNYYTIIIWVLLVGLLYPINDYIKALLKKYHQSFVLKIDVIVALIIFILVWFVKNIYILLPLYFILQFIVSLIIMFFVKKITRI